MQSLDCTDIKALLSGLIDDEVAEPTRHAAERHLASCRPCRTLIDEAEGVDELVHAEVASLLDPRGLPAGFEGGVLGQTLYETPRPGYLSRWTTWTGWIAAAAALALAATIWMLDQRQTSSGPIVRPPELFAADTPPVYPRTYTGVGLRSWTLDEVQDAGDSAASISVQSLTRDDADALYFAAVLLDMVLDPEGDLEQVREAAEYDRLVPKLRDIRSRLSVADRGTVLAAEALLRQILDGPIAEPERPALRATIGELELEQTLRSLSERWDESHSL